MFTPRVRKLAKVQPAPHPAAVPGTRPQKRHRAGPLPHVERVRVGCRDDDPPPPLLSREQAHHACLATLSQHKRKPIRVPTRCGQRRDGCFVQLVGDHVRVAAQLLHRPVELGVHGRRRKPRLAQGFRQTCEYLRVVQSRHLRWQDTSAEPFRN